MSFWKNTKVVKLIEKWLLCGTWNNIILLPKLTSSQSSIIKIYEILII